jgi:hypothetical protein
VLRADADPHRQLTAINLTAEEREELIAFLPELNADPD